MALPRHTFNLLTGIYLGHALTSAWWCNDLMRTLGFIGTITTVIFHGAHCLGYERWANQTFMKYDVSLVIVYVFSSMLSTSPEAWRFSLPVVAAAFGIWLLSFGVLKGLPYNPVQCAIHLSGVAAHVHNASFVCGMQAQSSPSV